MIGKLIAKIRENRKMTKTELSKLTKIDVGHLTHIEKEERNPSHKALRSICNALEVPYEPLMHTYDKVLTDEQVSYNATDHIKCDLIPIFGSIDGFSKCPKELFNTSFVFKAFDNSMSPKIQIDDFVYVELNCPLDNKDVGLFLYEGNLIVRKFIIRTSDIVLRAEDESVKDIVLTKSSEFYIIGKILGINNKNMSKFVVF